MAVYPGLMPAPGSFSNFTRFVNTSTAIPMVAQKRPEKDRKLGTTELIFCWSFLTIVFIVFASILLIDVYRKHGPQREPGERSFIMEQVDKVHEKMYICKDSFKRLFTKKQMVVDVEHAVVRDFDSQVIIDRLAAKSSSAEAATTVENSEDKIVGPMAGVEITVTPLDMSFLENDTVNNATVEDVTAKDASAGDDKAADV